MTDSPSTNVASAYQAGRAERDAEVAAHLKAALALQIGSLDESGETMTDIDFGNVNGQIDALHGVLAWIEVGEVETPSPEPTAG